MVCAGTELLEDELVMDDETLLDEDRLLIDPTLLIEELLLDDELVELLVDVEEALLITEELLDNTLLELEEDDSLLLNTLREDRLLEGAIEDRPAPEPPAEPPPQAAKPKPRQKAKDSGRHCRTARIKRFINSPVPDMPFRPCG